MKDKIKEILLNSYENGKRFGELVFNADEAADELTALMCYREVRAIFEWIGHKCWEPEFESEVVRQLKPYYPEEMIQKAIEQVKKETT